MTFKVAPGQQPRTFRLEGELDVAETEAFLEGIGDVSGSGDVVLELGDLAFIDSSGVRALLVLADRLQPDDVLVLRNAGPAVQRVFDLVAFEATRPAIRIDKPDRGPAPDVRRPPASRGAFRCSMGRFLFERPVVRRDVVAVRRLAVHRLVELG